MTQIFIFKVSVIFSANLVHLNIHIYLHNKYSKIHADTSHMTTTVLVSVGTLIIIMALLLYARRILRREITFRDRQNPLDYMPGEDLLQKYRLPRNNIINSVTWFMLVYNIELEEIMRYKFFLTNSRCAEVLCCRRIPRSIGPRSLNTQIHHIQVYCESVSCNYLQPNHLKFWN